jgi:hypothetical protein
VGGSPRGWSFISTGLACWRKWFFQYVLGLYPTKPSDALSLGAAFHMYMEGRPTEEVAAAFPEYAVEAKRLADARRAKGPPLPPAVCVEKEFVILDGYMTSKPDRIEMRGDKPIVRDFKTSYALSEKDEETWNVDGGILGECIAADTDECLVDITSKRQSAPEVKVVKVTLTPAKREALASAVQLFWREAEARVTRLAKDLSPKSPEAFDVHAPRSLASCVGKYGTCPYYARCWGRPPESLLYYYSEEPPNRWVEMEQGPQPKEWRVGKKSALDVVREGLRGKA